MVKKIYLVVQSFRGLNVQERSHDHFRNFGFAGGYLCHNDLHSVEEILEPSDIVSHFAKSDLKLDGLSLVHVLPLDQVCPPHFLPHVQI